MSVFDPNVPPAPPATPVPDGPTTPVPDGPTFEPFYCPGCGKQVGYMKECTGKPEAPHPPIEVVPTDELASGDTSQHTPAPSTENLG